VKLHKAKRTYGATSDMTPMIDIIFQLIIFFMVVSQFTSVAVETVTLPEAKKGEEPKQSRGERVIVNVHEDGRIGLFGREYTADTLPAAIEESVAGQDKEKVSVVLRADKRAKWNVAAGVLSAIAGCGISRIRIAVTEPQGAPPQP
jgi:biopolymer transport protein ExbD